MAAPTDYHLIHLYNGVKTIFKIKIFAVHNLRNVNDFKRLKRFIKY